MPDRDVPLDVLRFVARRTTNMIVVTDAAGAIAWVNLAFETVTGWRLDEIRGLKPGALLQGPGTDPAAVAAMGRAIAERREIRGLEILNYAKDGRPYWVALEIVPVEDPETGFSGFIAIESDVTESKRDALRLARQAEQLRDMARLGRIGAFEGVAGSPDVVCSDELYALFGVEARTPVTIETILDLMDEASRPAFVAAMASMADGAAEFDIEAKIANGRLAGAGSARSDGARRNRGSPDGSAATSRTSPRKGRASPAWRSRSASSTPSSSPPRWRIGASNPQPA